MDLNPPPVTTKDFGKTSDAVATDDTGSWSLLQLVKRLLQRGPYPTATHIDRSGTITTGGTAQQLMAANTGRRGYWIQNVSSGDLWISGQGTAAASQPSLKLVAGAYYESPVGGCPTSAISIFGATTAQAFSAREW